MLSVWENVPTTYINGGKEESELQFQNETEAPPPLHELHSHKEASK